MIRTEYSLLVHTAWMESMHGPSALRLKAKTSAFDDAAASHTSTLVRVLILQFQATAAAWKGSPAVKSSNLDTGVEWGMAPVP